MADLVGERPPGLRARMRCGIENDDIERARLQPTRQRDPRGADGERRSILERKADDGHPSRARCDHRRFDEIILGVVDFGGCVRQRRRQADLAGESPHGIDVARQAWSAIGGATAHQAGADLRIESEGTRDLIDVEPSQASAELEKRITKRDLQAAKHVVGQLGDLGLLDGHEAELGCRAVDPAEKRCDGLGGRRVVAADYLKCRVEEAGDDVAQHHEVRNIGKAELVLRVPCRMPCENRRDALANRPGIHGRADDDRVAVRPLRRGAHQGAAEILARGADLFAGELGLGWTRRRRHQNDRCVRRRRLFRMVDEAEMRTRQRKDLCQARLVLGYVPKLSRCTRALSLSMPSVDSPLRAKRAASGRPSLPRPKQERVLITTRYRSACDGFVETSWCRFSLSTDP